MPHEVRSHQVAGAQPCGGPAAINHGSYLDRLVAISVGSLRFAQRVFQLAARWQLAFVHQPADDRLEQREFKEHGTVGVLFSQPIAVFFQSGFIEVVPVLNAVSAAELLVLFSNGPIALERAGPIRRPSRRSGRKNHCTSANRRQWKWRSSQGQQIRGRSLVRRLCGNRGAADCRAPAVCRGC